MKYEAVIGLEVHAELLTKTKIFCGCPAEFGGEPNSHVCPICAGMPGVLPVLNQQVLEFAIMVGRALNCEIPEVSKFDRKNYFYPDNPKAYQISQFDQPICGRGWLEIQVGDEVKRIGITRAHMEEDAGKLVHQGAAGLAGSTHSLVDLNRAGVPLLEIVSEPELRTAEECKAYVQELRNILVYLGVNDGRLEQGSLRCDANVSVRPVGQEAFGTRAEIKNMNSFSAIERAVKYEIQRQIDAIEDGEKIVQETRLWNEERQVTVSMRSKEGSSDYRYFPDPDLIPMHISPELVAEIEARLPELPAAKRKRYQASLSAYDANVLASDKDMARFFDEAVNAYGKNPKGIANWIMGDILAHVNAEKSTFCEIKPMPGHVAKLVELIDADTISGKIAKTVLAKMLETGDDPAKLVESLGMSQISDTGAIVTAIQEVLKNHPQQVAQYHAGQTKVTGFLVGQIMRATQGRAKPDLVNQLLTEELAKV
ncbi:MAG: glutamyl-tRNA(Gln) amidotransferase, subunit [Cyanobacteria bacterium RYN_339]|nr:glutamyl-tRNA(Gln) amidotransferase, subunit [Cyanobacteria bacterium RYN_339]